MIGTRVEEEWSLFAGSRQNSVELGLKPPGPATDGRNRLD
jgi:hypothetical protein